MTSTNPEYEGLYVKLLFAESQYITGIIETIDPKTRKIALRSVHSFDSLDNEIGQFDHLIIKGTEIVDLDILDPPPGPDSSSHPVSMVPNSPSPPADGLAHLSNGLCEPSEHATNSRSLLPLLPEPTLSRLIKFTAAKLGPNTVQIIEGAARSIFDWIRMSFDIMVMNTAISFIVDRSRNGSITLAIARMVANTCITSGIAVYAIDIGGKDGNKLHNGEKQQQSEEKHFEFQWDLAVKNGISLYPLPSLEELNRNLASLEKSILIFGLSLDPQNVSHIQNPVLPVISIGSPILDLCNCSCYYHMDLILPTPSSIVIRNLYVADIGISISLLKRHLEKLSKMPSICLEMLFSRSSIVQLL